MSPTRRSFIKTGTISLAALGLGPSKPPRPRPKLPRSSRTLSPASSRSRLRTTPSA